MNFRRQWEGPEWQSYSYMLAQGRHGAANVQQVPDRVRGDCGIEFFTTDGCLYQCYAPEEVSDVAKAASAMKAKAQRDLRKLEKYKEQIAEILQSVEARRWVLLCPFLDNKEVVSYVRQQGTLLKAKGLSFIAEDFEALVHSQEDFNAEIEALRLRSLGPPLSVEPLTATEVDAASQGPLGARLHDKLSRAFPDESIEQRHARAMSCIKSLLIRDNTLDALRQDHPILWERSVRCLEAEEQRLSALGSDGHPATQLRDSMDRIEESLKQDLRDLPIATITTMSVGTVSDWLFRCPLDFLPRDGS
jgi:hypothetical protein